MTAKIAKMTYESNHFNRNQKIWLQFMTGNQAAKVTGKYRGKGRYVSAWIKWGTKNKPAPSWNKVEVSSEFAKHRELSC